MIKEDYVSLAIAKLLKEKGFDGICQAYYDTHGFSMFNGKGDNYETRPSSILAPTHQMAMKWLRETHKIFIEVGFNRFYETFNVYVFNMIEQEEDPFKLPERFDSYEQACETAIKYSLENLI